MKRHAYEQAYAAGCGYCLTCEKVAPDVEPHSVAPITCPACGADSLVGIKHALNAGAIELKHAHCRNCNARHTHDGDPETATCATCGGKHGVEHREGLADA